MDQISGKLSRHDTPREDSEGIREPHERYHPAAQAAIVQLDQNIEGYQQGSNRIHLKTHRAVGNVGGFTHESGVGKFGAIGGRKCDGRDAFGMEYLLAQHVSREGKSLSRAGVKAYGISKLVWQVSLGAGENIAGQRARIVPLITQ